MTNFETGHQEPQNDISSKLLEIINGFKYESDYQEIDNLFDSLDNSISLLLGRSYIYVYRNDITDSQHTHARVQVGRIKIDQNAKPIKFIADRDENIVSDTFDRLDSHQFFKQIRIIFNIPNLGEEAKIKALEFKKTENKKAEAEIQKNEYVESLALLNSSRPQKSLSKDEKVISVRQGMYKITDSEHQYIETQGLAPCVGVVIWNSETKEAGIIHIDAKTNIQNGLSNLISSLEIKDKSKMQVHVIGGRPLDVTTGSEESMIKNLVRDQLIEVDIFFEQEGIKMTSYDVWTITGNTQNDIKSIILDKETGILYDFKKSK